MCCNIWAGITQVDCLKIELKCIDEILNEMDFHEAETYIDERGVFERNSLEAKRKETVRKIGAIEAKEVA